MNSLSARGGSPLRLGLLGAARIAPAAAIEPASGLVDVVGLAARERGRTEAFASVHGIPRVFDDYAALVDSPEVDAVYIALPCSHHHEWTSRALDAGKHVLCEKPLSCNAGETRELVERDAGQALGVAGGHSSGGGLSAARPHKPKGPGVLHKRGADRQGTDRQVSSGTA